MARLCLSPAARTTADATKRSLNVGFGILIFSTSAALSLLTIRGRSHITSAAGGGYAKSWPLLTEGGGGVQEPLILADVICEQPLIIITMTSVWQAKYITRCRAHNHPRSLIQNVASPPPCHCHHQHHSEEHLRTRHEFSSLTILDEFVQLDPFWPI